MVLPAVLTRYHAEIKAEINSIISQRASPMYNMLRYHLGWVDNEDRILDRSNGKAVRPTLCLLACAAAGGEYRQALPMAAAVELVHNYSLIHDDIQDDDSERHHQPTVWRVWGKPQAINAGSAMRMLAGVAVRRLAVPGELQLRLLSLLDEATLALIEGQYLDISFESQEDVGISDYLKMIGCKTAALMACAVASGAELGTRDHNKIKALYEFGWQIGMAFQTRDDILGIWGKQEETGKPSGNDVRRRKKTLPVIYGLARASQPRRELLLQYYRQSDPAEGLVPSVIGILEDVGALAEAQKTTEENIARALSVIDCINLDSAPRQDLEAIASFLKNRDY